MLSIESNEFCSLLLRDAISSQELCNIRISSAIYFSKLVHQDNFEAGAYELHFSAELHTSLVHFDFFKYWRDWGLPETV